MAAAFAVALARVVVMTVAAVVVPMVMVVTTAVALVLAGGRATVIAHEVHGLAAGVVLPAVAAPVLRMAGGTRM